MKLTPIDIEQQKFRRVMRGYDMREVQQFLEMVAQQTAELTHEVGDLKSQVRRGQQDIEALRSREEALKEAMLTAQKAIDDLRDSAHKEAQLVLGEAEMRAEKILHNAHAKATQVHEDIQELRRQRVRLLEELRGVINTHARLLDVHGSDVPDFTQDRGMSLLDRLRAPSPPDLDDAVSAPT